jgi:tRNA modification GTPase
LYQILFNANSEATRRTALNQINGGFSKKIGELRENLIHFASMFWLKIFLVNFVAKK